jgi:hypothetical protein
MRQIYSPPKYYQRIRSILKELKVPAVTVPPIGSDSWRFSVPACGWAY